MHCFAGENQIYTGTVILDVESFKSLKGQENVFFVGKYGMTKYQRNDV